MTLVSALSTKSAVSASIVCALIGACGGEDGASPHPAPVAAAATPASAHVALESPAQAAAPEPPAQAPVVQLGAGFTPDPWVLAGEVEGNVDAAGLDGECSGYIPSRPSVVFQADTAITELTLIAQGTEPGVTLMVQGPDGDFRCAGEPTGDAVRLSGYFAAGEHKIWLGTSTEGAHLRFRLGFSELPDVTASNVASTALAP